MITSIVLIISERTVFPRLKRSVDTNAVYSKRYDNVFVLDPLVVFELDNPVRITTSRNGPVPVTVTVELNLIQWLSSVTGFQLAPDVILNIRQCKNFEFAPVEQLAYCEIFYQDWTELIENSLESNCDDSNSYALYQTCIGEASGGE